MSVYCAPIRHRKIDREAMQCSYSRNTRISDLSIPGIVVIARSGSWHAMFDAHELSFLPVHIVEPRLLIRGVAIKPVVQVLYYSATRSSPVIR